MCSPVRSSPFVVLLAAVLLSITSTGSAQRDGDSARGGSALPSVTITSPPSDTTVASGQTTLFVSGTASDFDGSVVAVQWRLNNNDWNTATGTTNWTFTSAGLTYGDNLIEVRAVDNSGDRSPIESRTITRETDVAFAFTGVLNTNAETDFGADRSPRLATDGAGEWLAVWTSDEDLDGAGTDDDILVARSTDHGATWTDPAALAPIATTDTGDDSFPTIATDSAGVWLAVWQSTEPGAIVWGPDLDIFVSRSTDNGASWTAIAPIHDAAGDSGDDLLPEIATDGAGTWGVVWQSGDTLGGTIGSDADILFARSTDDGTNWSAPVVVNSYAATDSDSDLRPVIATDGAGTWIAVWASNTTQVSGVGTDLDLLYAVSTDDGDTWTAAAALNTNAITDGGADQDPAIAVSADGRFVVAWNSDDAMGGTLGSDDDILSSYTTDGGTSWSSPAVVNSFAASDSGSDAEVALSTDSLGNWVAAWSFRDFSIGADNDVFTALSRDGGETWETAAALNPNSGGDSGDDTSPAILSDSAGRWTTAWQSSEDLGPGIGSDDDLFYSRSLFALRIDPTVTITTPASNPTIASSQTFLNVAGTAADADGTIAQVRYRLNGGSWSNAIGTSTWLFTALGLQPGDNLLEVRATDAQGYRSAISTRTVTRNIRPTVTIAQPTNDTVVPNAQTSINLSGSASDATDAIAVVEYRLDGGGWVAATGTTSWTFTVSGLALGDTFIEVRATDAFGEMSNIASRLVSRNRLPSVTITSPATDTTVPSGQTSITVSGTANESDPGDSVTEVEWRNNGGSWNPATGTSNWTFDESALVVGVNFFEVRAIDEIGEAGPIASRTVTRNAAPTLSITTPATDTTIPNAQTSFAFAGTASDAVGTIDSVEYRIDGGGWNPATGTDSWSFTATGLAVGANLVEVRATDDSGETSAIASRTITRNALPTVSISTPATDQNVLNAQTSFAFSGTAADSVGSVAMVEWRNNGGAWNGATGTTSWSFSASSLVEGANLIEVRATDDFGESSAIASRTITRNQLPTLGIDTPASDTTVPNAQTTFAFSGTAGDAGGSINAVEYRVNGGGWTPASGTASWSFTASGLNVGANLVEVRATDDLGETSAIGSRTITRNALPTASIATPVSDVLVPNPQTSFPFNGSASDSDGTITLVEWRNNGGGWTSATGTDSWSFTASGLVVGDNFIEVRSTDDTGDTSPLASRTVTREQPPAGIVIR